MATPIGSLRSRGRESYKIFFSDLLIRFGQADCDQRPGSTGILFSGPQFDQQLIPAWSCLLQQPQSPPQSFQSMKFGVLRRSIGYDMGELGQIRLTAGCNRVQAPAGHGPGYCWN
ncbi:MAG: hypothetical protein EA370_08350 [Wenzhouxiangella sp.]|nr:MAG: hypothetical protein EA370_08350 [Wenzhouxiangella sp.]